MTQSTDGEGDKTKAAPPRERPGQPDQQAPSDQQAQQAEAQQPGPGVHVLGQYIKDLSFENPGAPGSLRPSEAQPKLEVNVNVNAKSLSQTEFEVELKLTANARRDQDTLFIAEVVYAGLFQVRNVPQEHVRPVVLIECPRLLFPFARQILADATRQGGFPPLMIDPVDFAALYRHNLAQQSQAQQSAPPPTS